MTTARFKALETTGERSFNLTDSPKAYVPSDCFGKSVFTKSIIKKMLPKPIAENLIAAMDGISKIDERYADKIAEAMKKWAMGLGATHFCHWFQPLTGAPAEKHDSFIEWDTKGSVIEKFSGNQLIQGEPDASSFPSGGLRTTFEARGYTGWDPTSPAFVWKGGDGVTLCIPSVFFSWTGAVLDAKIPLLRSDKKISDACLRLLKFTGIPASLVYSTVGMEQEYFVIDKALRNLRPDLLLLGRTVVGAPSPKGQELQDHYFGSVKNRILRFMRDFEVAAFELSIPVKTRHNEVAPAQHEVAPLFEKASIAIDHNLLLMEVMKQVANKHNLSCLVHEKPFHNINGSGKHCNWSLATDTGINLLDPTETPENTLHFLILLVAILKAIHENGALLRASIGSLSNDFRLGGHEAPPAIMSVYLGEALEQLLDNIAEKGAHKSKSSKEIYNLGLHIIPDLKQDNTDRNRTSPFAFTGNKFEFRAVGSSANSSFPIMTLNAIVAQSLNELMDEIEKLAKGQKKKDPATLLSLIMPLLKKHIVQTKGIRFGGDNYSHEWVEEAKKRGLPNLKKSLYAFESLNSPSTKKAFDGILHKEELKSRYEILTETYGHTLNIEIKTLLDIFNTMVIPTAVKYQGILADSISEMMDLVSEKGFTKQKELLKSIAHLIEEGLTLSEKIADLRSKIDSKKTGFEKAKDLLEQVFPECLKLRQISDQLEEKIDDSLWPLPKYRELLYIV